MGRYETIVYVLMGAVMVYGFNAQYGIVRFDTLVGMVIVLASVGVAAFVMWFVVNTINVDQMAPPKP